MGSGRSVAVDFDGVIRDWGTNKPIDGAKNGINLLREMGFSIIIHSCNRREFIEQWLYDYDIRFDHIWDGIGKPVASIYLDDNGLRFLNWERTIQDVKDLKYVI